MKLFYFLSIFTFSEALPLGNSPVTVAVVEYQPITSWDLTPDERILANTAAYITLLRNASEQGARLVIFPEDTLTNDDETAVETTIGDNPCNTDTYPKFLQELSCASKDLSVYIVVNLVEKVKCNNPDTSTSENCKNTGYFFYNTDVLFNPQGIVANKYHKYNLFGEKTRDRPSHPEVVVFETDFARFGIFTCFDILFKSPAQDILTNDIDGVIFPTMWFSELPFLTSLQTQQMWSQTHNVKLFASGANNPFLGSGGSGFYDGHNGLIEADIVAKGGSQIIFHSYTPSGESSISYTNNDIIDAIAKEMDSFYLKPDPSITDYSSKLLDTNELDIKEEVCSNDFCCDFSIKISKNKTESGNSYTYHLVAFSGTRHYPGIANAGIDNCGLIACLDSSLSSCSQRFPDYDDVNWPITFEEIQIGARFEANENRTQFPNSLLSSIRPISASQTLWAETEVEIDGKNYVEAGFKLKEPQSRLLTFAIVGRNFALDSFES